MRGYSLVQRHPEEQMLSIHRLVQAVLRDAMGEAEREAWAQRMMRLVSQALLLPQGVPCK